jgi:hypothetical protein
VLSDPHNFPRPRRKGRSISSVKRRDGISKLIPAAADWSLNDCESLGLFSNTNDWIFVWLGWQADGLSGIILWSQGINKLIEARF